jgi:hypothetical protein
VSWICANDHHSAVPAEDLALVTHLFDACSNLHALSRLLVAIGNATSSEVIGSDLDLYAVAGENANAVHTHLSGTVGKNRVAVFQFYFEHGVRQRFDHGPFKDNRVFLGLWQLEIPSRFLKNMALEQGNRESTTNPPKASEDTNAFSSCLRHSR